MPISTGPVFVIDVDGTLTKIHAGGLPTLSPRAAMIVKLAEFARTNGIQPIIMTAGEWIKSGTRATYVLQKLFTDAGQADLWQAISQYPMYNRGDFDLLGFYNLNQIKAPLLDIIRKKITAGQQYTPHDYDAVILDDQDWQGKAATAAKKYAVDPEDINFDLELLLALLLLYPGTDTRQYRAFLSQAEQFAAQNFGPQRDYHQCGLLKGSINYSAASKLNYALTARDDPPLPTLTKYFLSPLQNVLNNRPILQQYLAPKPLLVSRAPIKRSLPEPITTTPHHDTVALARNTRQVRFIEPLVIANPPIRYPRRQAPTEPIADYKPVYRIAPVQQQPIRQPVRVAPLPPQIIEQQQAPRQELTTAVLFENAITPGNDFLRWVNSKDPDLIAKLNFSNKKPYPATRVNYPPPVFAYLASRIHYGSASQIPYAQLGQFLSRDAIFWAARWLADSSFDQLTNLPKAAVFCPELVWFFVKKYPRYLNSYEWPYHNAELGARGQIHWRPAMLSLYAACGQKIKALRSRFDPQAWLFCWDTDCRNKETVKAAMEPLALSASSCRCGM